MFENFKKIAIQSLVLFLNVALVGGGVSYFKKEQEKKDLASKAEAVSQVETIDPIAEKAAQLEQIIAKASAQKSSNASKNSGKITVQQPKTVTEVIPGGTKTVTVQASSPTKTTKKS